MGIPEDILFAFDVHVNPDLKYLEKIQLIIDRIQKPEESKEVDLASLCYHEGYEKKNVVEDGFVVDQSFPVVNSYFKIKCNSFNASALPVLSSKHDRYDITGGVSLPLMDLAIDSGSKEMKKDNSFGSIEGTYRKIRINKTISTYATTVDGTARMRLPRSTDEKNEISFPVNINLTWDNATNTYSLVPFKIDFNSGIHHYRFQSDDRANKKADGNTIYAELIRLKKAVGP